MGQLADAKGRLAQATAEEEQSRVKLGMSEKELKVLEGRWKEVEREAGDGKKNLEKVKAETEKFRRKVEESGWSAEKEREGVDALRVAKGEERRLSEVSIFLRIIERLPTTLTSTGKGCCQTTSSVTRLPILDSFALF